MTTKQQTFDCVAQHYDDLAARGVMSYDSDEICKYRASNGEVCGVGRLIPDSDYTPAMENTTVLCNLLIQAVLRRYGHDIQLTYDLQRIHDRRDDILDFQTVYRRELARVAKEHNLEYKP